MSLNNTNIGAAGFDVDSVDNNEVEISGDCPLGQREATLPSFARTAAIILSECYDRMLRFFIVDLNINNAVMCALL